MFDRLRRHKPPLRQVSVNNRICHSCGACAGACPANAIYLHNSHLRIEPGCTHCERCVPVCPLGALFLIDLPAEAAK